MTGTRNMREYRQKISAAIANEFQRTALDNFAVAYRGARKSAFEGQDVEALIREAGRVKQEGIDRMQELFEEFRERAEALGVHVHLARTAAEANALIGTIARENGCTRIVKSKSMTAEETFLNRYLEGEGHIVTETDLGEWIVQLREERPSHMVLPAIHLSRFDVASLFSRVTGADQSPDIQRLVKVARRELRERFVTADMGITGANFAVADTGTLGLVTNEGNARLVTTLPRVHVALVGLDKLLPTLKDAMAILKVLPRNATGQTITSYLTWITGSGECAAAPRGRKIMHVVFLDNGRSALARDPVFSQVLRCVRCGACANVCPCYRMVGGHQYGHVYIGAVGLVLTYFYHGRDRAAGLIQNCVNCEACREVCAAGIDLPFLIREVQERIGTEGGHPGISRFMGMALKNRRLFHGLLRAAAKVQKPLVSQGFLRHLPMVFREQEFRAIPAIVDRPFRDRWPALRREVKNPRQRVALFGGCVQDFVYPEQLEAAVRTMARKGTDVEFPLGQTCCGLPARMMGEANTARDVALLNVAAIDPNEYDLIVTLCASCASHLKYTYPRLFAGHAESEARMRQFADKVVDYSSFLTEVLELGPEDFDPSGETVAYHYPCHQCRGMGVKRQPKELLRMAGFKYHPAAEEDVCCGLGGTFSLKFPQISAQILAKKLDNMAATGADLLLTECPGCVMQLRGGMKRRGEKMAVKHIAEAVAGVLNKECEPDHGP